MISWSRRDSRDKYQSHLPILCVLLYIRSYSGLATKIFIAIATVKIWQLIKEIDEMHASCPVSGKLKHPNIGLEIEQSGECTVFD